MDSRNLNESIMLVQNLHNNYGGAEKLKISKEFKEKVKLVNGHEMAIQLIYNLIRKLKCDNRAKLLGKIEFKGLNLYNKPRDKPELMQDINKKIHLGIYEIAKKFTLKDKNEVPEVVEESDVRAEEEEEEYGEFDLDVNDDEETQE